MTKSQELKTLNKPWVKAALGTVLLAIAYGFASLAIDSGRLLDYGLTILFLILGVKYLVRSVRS